MQIVLDMNREERMQISDKPVCCFISEHVLKTVDNRKSVGIMD